MVPVTEEGWSRCYRIISSRFPPVGLYHRVANPGDLEAVHWIEGLTNPRLRQEAGEIALVPEADRLSGPGTTPIMAAFTHLNPNGSRFSDGRFGVYYGAAQAQTAIAETVHHTERWARESRDPPLTFTMRVYVGALQERPYHDIRALREACPHLYHPDDYGPGQALGRDLRGRGAWGLIYGSVRHPAGVCVAVFRPSALGPVRQTQHLAYVWNGERIIDVQVTRSLGRPNH